MDGPKMCIRACIIAIFILEKWCSMWCFRGEPRNNLIWTRVKWSFLFLVPDGLIIGRVFSDILHLVADRRLSGSSQEPLVFVKWPELSTRQIMMLQPGGLRAFILPWGSRVNSCFCPCSLNSWWFMTATADSSHQFNLCQTCLCFILKPSTC